MFLAYEQLIFKNTYLTLVLGIEFFLPMIDFYFREIWNRFLEFESNIGDLASIVKVEKRRSAVLEKVSLVIKTVLITSLILLFL